MRRRVDLQIARIELDALASPTGSPRRRASSICWRSPAYRKTTREPDGDACAERGFEVEFQVPLFDFGEVRVRRGRANLHAGGQPPDRRRSTCAPKARDAYRAYRVAYDIARALPARSAAAAQDHLGRNAAALQRHADRRVRAAGRSARSASPRPSPRSKRSATSGSPSADLRAAVVGGGAARRHRRRTTAAMRRGRRRRRRTD